MNVLVMDTAHEALAVTLITGDRLYYRVNTEKNGHSVSLLPAVEELLTESGLTLGDMDYFSANVGPGSFTGIRIGVCTANAFGYVFNKPLLPLTTFIAGGEEGENLYLDARHGNCYFRDKNGTSGFTAISSLPQDAREIPGISTAEEYKKAVEYMIKNKLETDTLAPVYLKASEAECKE